LTAVFDDCFVDSKPVVPDWGPFLASGQFLEARGRYLPQPALRFRALLSVPEIIETLAVDRIKGPPRRSTESPRFQRSCSRSNRSRNSVAPVPPEKLEFVAVFSMPSGAPRLRFFWFDLPSSLYHFAF
jgi:hypothetical protein